MHGTLPELFDFVLGGAVNRILVSANSSEYRGRLTLVAASSRFLLASDRAVVAGLEASELILGIIPYYNPELVSCVRGLFWEVFGPESSAESEFRWDLLLGTAPPRSRVRREVEIRVAG